ncbi:hypothetical protein LSTR_LSTR004221 [Laodelphax striatellus]|uniref:Uncharacterized protein n=1 Tax=Laodelphax striatellus TaxID=195883 RepID=A0A482X9J0_LAOST|nr:hypothetical protein LSTR_LSTR004221 [Laodelphax striatellus]
MSQALLPQQCIGMDGMQFRLDELNQYACPSAPLIVGVYHYNCSIVPSSANAIPRTIGKAAVASRSCKNLCLLEVPAVVVAVAPSIVGVYHYNCSIVPSFANSIPQTNGKAAVASRQEFLTDNFRTFRSIIIFFKQLE